MQTGTTTSTLTGAANFLPGAAARPFAETARRNELSDALASLLAGESFRELTVPLIDFAAPYDGVVPDELLRRTYRFTDRDGALLLLRSDFTPMVARSLAPLLVPAELPLRAFYRGEIIRCDERQQARGGAIYEVGAEIVGGDEAEVDSYLLSLAANIGETLGIRSTLAFSDASLVDALAGAAFDAVSARSVRASLLSKRRDSTAQFDALMPGDVAGLASAFVRGNLRADELLAVEATAAIGRRLLRLEEAVAARSGDAVTIRLAVDSGDVDAGYYTGFRFHLIAPSERTPLASGGRYDRLYGRFGTEAPAAGFTFNVDAIERAR